MQLLVQKKADTNLVDGKKRGCLQLARQCQGKNKPLANWLMQNVPNIQDSWGSGRKHADKSRGQFSYALRIETGPTHDKGRGGKGYEPQGGHQGKGDDSRTRKGGAASSSSSRSHRSTEWQWYNGQWWYWTGY